MSGTVRLRVACLAMILAVLAACGGNSSSKEEIAVKDRPPMETMVERYQGMQDDLFVQLGRDFGAQAWGVSANSAGVVTTACDDDPEGEHYYFPGMSFTGTYPADQWEKVKALVEKVGREHGFADTAVVVDKPGDLDLVGEDKYGGRYEFGMATNTIFEVHTGCHRWNKKPPATP